MSEVKKRVRSKKPRNAPSELSTRAPCGTRLCDVNISKKITDPRFREECGEIDKVGFVKNYAFLQENREAEIKALEEQIEDDPSLSSNEEFQRHLQSLRDQHKTMAAKISDVNDSIAWHREERAAIAQGKRPFWLGKKDMTMMKQKKRFEQLSSTGKLDKYLNKRKKKLLAKDKKAFF